MGGVTVNLNEFVLKTMMKKGLSLVLRKEGVDSTQNKMFVFKLKRRLNTADDTYIEIQM